MSKAVIVMCAILFCGAVPAKAVTVWTQHYDNNRTGANLNESVLTTANVNSSTFGKLFSIPVDDWMYAEPLYVPGLTVDGALHNVLYITTMSNSLYAFDADTGILLWHKNYGAAPRFSDTGESCGLYDPTHVGILSTPVIDTSTNTMYFVHFNLNTDGTYHQYIRAVDITTGLDKFNSPQEILLSATGVSAFLPQYQTQRTALTLANGKVYMAWANDDDCGAYHGWIAGYDSSDLSQPPAVFVDTNGASNVGGIWMGGNGMVADASGNLYAVTGNGLYDGSVNFGDSVLKLSPSLSLLDWFTPSNAATLGSDDGDLGSAGAIGIPNSTDLIAGGKSHELFLINTGDMGQFNATTDQVLQEFQAADGLIESGPVFWNDPSTPTYYVWSMNDVARAYSYNGSRLSSTPVSTSTVSNSNFSPGISLSANGSNAGTAILWANVPGTGDGLVTGTLYAFDATNLNNVLYNSNQNATRDAYGSFMHFMSPVVTNGKVYLGSARLVAGYGLLNGTPTPTNLTATASSAAAILSWTASSGATTYNIYRATATGAEQAPSVASVSGTAFTDTGLVNNKKYFYFVTAVGANGESLPSTEVNVTPQQSYPTVVTAAAAAPNPVTGTTTSLSVLGGYFNGESKLTYTWSSTGPAAVVFSANGTNAAKNCTATFSTSGAYAITVTLTSPSALTATSSVGVTVNSTLAGLSLTPGPTLSLAQQTTQQFTATLDDQFGPVSPQPTMVYSLTAGSVGSIGLNTGIYHSGTVIGTATVKAKTGAFSAATTVTVGPPKPTVETQPAATPNPASGTATNLSVLGAYTGTGGAASLTYTWSSTGPAAVAFSVNGTNAAKNTVATFSQSGTYTFSVSIKDTSNDSVSASTSPVVVNQTLTSIGVSPASITLPLATSQPFTAVAYDQFGIALATQPTFAWNLVSPSVGSLNSVTGLYHSGPTTGTATVKAKSGTIGGTAAVTVN